MPELLGSFRRSPSEGGWSGPLRPMRFTAPRRPPTGRRIEDGKSLGGFLGNFFEDLRDSLMGIPTGLVQFVRSPIQTTKAVGAATWKDYSPLFSGDFDKFADNLYDHPLAPMLDIAAVFTGGAGLAAKGVGSAGRAGNLGSLSAKAAKVDRPDPRVIDVASPVEFTKHYARNPLIRARQKGTERLVDTLAALQPRWFGGQENVAKALATGHAADFRRQTKFLAKQQSYRRGAARAMADLQMAAIVRLGKEATETPETVAAIVSKHGRDNLETHAYRVAPEKLMGDITPSEKWNKNDYEFQVQRVGRAKARISAKVAKAQEQRRNAQNAYHATFFDQSKPPRVGVSGNRLAQEASQRKGFYEREMARAREQADRADEVRDRFERIMFRDEYYIDDFMAYGIKVGKGTDLQSARTKLREKLYADRLATAEARDRVAAAEYGFEQASKAGQEAAAVQRGELTAAQKANARKRKAAREKAMRQIEETNAKLDKLRELEKRNLEREASLFPYVLPEGFRFLRQNEIKGEIPDEVSREAFEDWVARIPARNTTTRASEAMRDENGNFMLVHDQSVSKWSEEARQSLTFAQNLYKRPTAVWKWMVLATAPRYFVNNAVGNTFMYLMSMGGAGAIRGFVDAVRQVKGEQYAERMMKDAVKEVARLHTTDWQSKWYLGVHAGFGREGMQAAIDVAGKRVNVAKVMQGLYPITHKYSDVFIRRMSINVLIRQMPEYQEAFKRLEAQGLDPHRAHDMAADEASKHAHVRQHIQEQVNNVLGDYHHLEGWERGVRQIIPFYTWDRAIARHGIKMALDRPGRSAMMVRLGEEGQETNRELLGRHMPNFLRASLPLAALGLADDTTDDPYKRRPVFSTAGINPYSTIPGLFDTVASLTGIGDDEVRPGEAVASHINPLVTGAFEAISGRSLLTGAPTDEEGGVLQKLAQGVVENTPAARLISATVHGAPEPKRDQHGRIRSPLLFKGDLEQQAGAWLGAPIKRVSPEKAADLYRREKGITLGDQEEYRMVFPDLKSLAKAARQSERRRPRRPRRNRRPSGSGSIRVPSLNQRPKRILPRIEGM